MNKTKLAIVIPCYNEEETLSFSMSRLIEVLNDLISEKQISESSFLFFVDDGSLDKTWEIIHNAHLQNPDKIKGTSFTTNFGNQNAIIAGLDLVNDLGVDCAITIDADLQQDETKIGEFVQKYKNGADIVAGIRNNRDTDDLLKKIPATLFYKFMNVLGVKLRPNHSEYRLVSKKTLEIISNYKETKLFLRGLFYELGLKTDYVYFDVKKRKFGVSKFNFFSLLRLAAYGIVSFSVRPLRFVFLAGLVISFASFFVGILWLYLIFIKGHALFGIEGYEICEMFFSGLEILCIGIIGEYVGQILEEVKSRPRYIIDKDLK